MEELLEETKPVLSDLSALSRQKILDNLKDGHSPLHIAIWFASGSIRRYLQRRHCISLVNEMKEQLILSLEEYNELTSNCMSPPFEKFHLVNKLCEALQKKERHHVEEFLHILDHDATRQLATFIRRVISKCDDVAKDYVPNSGAKSAACSGTGDDYVEYEFTVKVRKGKNRCEEGEDFIIQRFKKFKKEILCNNEMNQNIKKQCIKVHLKLDDWDFDNLQRDIATGVLEQRVCVWLHKEGFDLPNNLSIEATLMPLQQNSAPQSVVATNIQNYDDGFYLLVAAIDFGTTFSGYAFSMITSPTDIRMNKNWGQEFGHSSYKAPTCVLTGPSGEFVSFGYKAEADYLDFCTEKTGGYDLYRHFKMKLHGKKISFKSSILSTRGTVRAAIDIFTMALKYLKDHLLSVINASLSDKVNESMIRWVLTVPAIWKDEAKQFMREASFKAGLIKEKNSKKLIMALEPEAASIYCRNLDLKQFKGGDEKAGDINFKAGERYLMVDSGGGTVDITVHTITSKGEVHEIFPPSGGPWGCIYADANFERLLEELFSVEFIQSFKRNEPRDWMDIMLSFETTKPIINTGEKNLINITLSYNFDKAVKKKFGEGIDKFIKNKATASDLGIMFRNGSLTLQDAKAKSLFQPLIEEITSHLQMMLQTLGNLDYVLLVGGFSHFQPLQNAIVGLFKQVPGCAVLVPVEAQLAIVEGAVTFGHQPDSITSRIAKCSYGFEVMRPFNSKEHEPIYKTEMRGIVWCTELFKAVIQKGQAVEIGTTKEHTVGNNDMAMYTGYTEVNIFRSEDSNAKYTNQQGVTKIATLKVPYIENADDLYALKSNKKITVSMTFGGTEIIIRAKDGDSGEWVKETVVDYFYT